MIIHGQFGFNCQSGFREEAFRNIFSIGSNVKLSSAVAAILNFISEQKTTLTIETKLPMNDHWTVLYQVTVFYADRKSKMAATAGHRLTLDPMGTCSNAIGSNVKLSSAVAAILNFISEQKT
jgi:hypothetical protein